MLVKLISIVPLLPLTGHKQKNTEYTAFSPDFCCLICVDKCCYLAQIFLKTSKLVREASGFAYQVK